MTSGVVRRAICSVIEDKNLDLVVKNDYLYLKGFGAALLKKITKMIQ